MAHEVAHTLQDRGDGNKTGISTGDEPAEREADEAARAVTAGRAAEITADTSAGVHRWGLGDLASGAWDAVKSGASGACDTVKSGATSAWDATTNKVSEAANATKDWATSTYDSAKTWTGEKVDQAKGWADEKVDQAKEWGIDKGIDALSWLDDRYHDTYKPGLDWVRNKVDGGSDALKDGVSAGSGWLADGLDWLGWTTGGDGIRDAGKWVNNKVDGVKDTLGLNETGNSFTHAMEIPKNKDGFVQQYSELGLPLTTEAWSLQDRIDGGKLHRINNTALLNHMVGAGQLSDKDLPQDLTALSSEELQGLVDRSVLPVLAQSGALKELVDSGAIKADQIPASFDEMDPKALKALADSVRSAGAERSLLDAMSPEDRSSWQEGILNTYIDQANHDPNAAMLLDVMPTETDYAMDGSTVEDTLSDALLKGQEPNDFRVGERTGRIRQGSVMMADELRTVQGKNTYGLTVPYADTAENILFRNGKPTDAAEHVHNYLSKLDPDTTSLLNGYSQGGGAVLEYLREYGDKDGLDYGVALAPMGGASKDDTGGEGAWGGNFNGVQTLSLMNKNDPAQYIHGKDLSEMGPGLLNFIADNKDKKLGGDSEIHSGFDEAHPENGTYG